MSFYKAIYSIWSQYKDFGVLLIQSTQNGGFPNNLIFSIKKKANVYFNGTSIHQIIVLKDGTKKFRCYPFYRECTDI